MSAGEIREQLYDSASAIGVAVEHQHVVNDRMVELGQLSAGIRDNLASLGEQLAACEEILRDNTGQQVAAKSKIDESISWVTTAANGTSVLDRPISLLNAVSKGSQLVIDTTGVFAEQLPTVRRDIEKMAVYMGSLVTRLNGVGQVAGKNITESLTAKIHIEETANRY